MVNFMSAVTCIIFASIFLLVDCRKPKNEYNYISQSDDVYLKTGRKIVGGVSIDVRKYPYIAAIQTVGRKQKCGGTLILPDWILTAAHCLVVIEDIGLRLENVNHYVVVMGTHDIRPDKGTKSVQIRNPILFVPHSGFNHHYMVNDIGLIKVDKDFDIKTRIQMVILPKKPAGICHGEMCAVIGWGYLEDPYYHVPGKGQHAELPSNMHMVYVPIMEISTCQYYYSSDIVHERMNICAGYEHGEKDACIGDSGGPLICNGTQRGIVSWGLGCAQSYSPGIYSRVDHFLSWINETLDKRRNYSLRGGASIYLIPPSVLYLFIVNVMIELQLAYFSVS